MPINAVPERSNVVQGEKVLLPEMSWLEWFRSVFYALFGWKRSYSGSASLNFGNIAAGGEEGLTMTVRGARAGDAVIVTPASKVTGIIDNVGVVTANDTVTVYAHNITAGAINPAERTFRAVCLQQ